MLTIACLLMSGLVKVTSLLAKAGSGLGFSLGVGAWTEMEIQWVKGMYGLKLVSSEKIQSLKGHSNSLF